MKGRKPKPTSLKLISMSHNIRKDSCSEPQAEGDLLHVGAALGAGLGGVAAH